LLQDSVNFVIGKIPMITTITGNTHSKVSSSMHISINMTIDVMLADCSAVVGKKPPRHASGLLTASSEDYPCEALVAACSRSTATTAFVIKAIALLVT